MKKEKRKDKGHIHEKIDELKWETIKDRF